ncbi:MAG: RNase adapter RapZ [Chloroflexi bacterium]|nr:RNase adapter RapZ [Chloroflexota bacterium]
MAHPFIVMTGLSGAGKSIAIKVLEDIGYYTLDNLPPALIPDALRVCGEAGYAKVAFVIDVRSGPLFQDAVRVLEQLKKEGRPPHLLFFDASDEVLIRRYSETRHRHPLETPGGVVPSIAEERRLLVELRARADKVIDTTHLSVKDLRDTLHSLYGEGTSGMLVHVTSFGYKYGIPQGADLVFDVRFMQNPFYIPELKALSGSDEPVRRFVLDHRATKKFMGHVIPFLRELMPRYEEEKKARLGIAFGCTGGRHRSVTIADEVAGAVKTFWPGEITVEHRDRDRADERT